ncbi:hypothetical protein F4809DRAFT_234619 [Biscogniauxia mediterranea]|nr:hypothetical protein F4809DRAFT_234619 [Biscogniauxia mediterranea]
MSATVGQQPEKEKILITSFFFLPFKSHIPSVTETGKFCERKKKRKRRGGNTSKAANLVDLTCVSHHHHAKNRGMQRRENRDLGFSFLNMKKKKKKKEREKKAKTMPRLHRRLRCRSAGLEGGWPVLYVCMYVCMYVTLAWPRYHVSRSLITGR